MSQDPSCFGNYQGLNRDMTLEPGVDACRRCQPYRRCREETKRRFIYAFRSGIERGHAPPCWRKYPAGGWVCAACPLAKNSQCQRETKQREHEEHVAKKENAELTFIQRLRKKTEETWGDAE